MVPKTISGIEPTKDVLAIKSPTIGIRVSPRTIGQMDS